jgi:hypothetical protein
MRRTSTAAQLLGPEGDGRPPTTADDEGEVPPEAREIALLFPAISQKQIAAIFEGSFDPKYLYKLHLANEDENEITFV